MQARLLLPLLLSTACLLQPSSIGAQQDTPQQSSKPRKFQLLTAERIESLAEPQQTTWTNYMRRSEELHQIEVQRMREQCDQLGLTKATPAPQTSSSFEIDSGKSTDWYKSQPARDLADVIISYQTTTGAWSKAVDYSKGKRAAGSHWTSQTGNVWHYCGTLDNRSTTEQIRFLAWVHSASEYAPAADACRKGIQWLFWAQFPNGGWPQNYPIEPGYHEAITLNDDAMLHALELMSDIAQSKPPFQFLEASTRDQASKSYQRGLDCLAQAQVRVGGVPTVWCAQHDPLDLTPVGARKKEPPSLSGAESANLLKYLMRSGPINDQTSAMIQAGVHWLSQHRITGLRKTKNAQGKTEYVADEKSSEVYWARFYDVQTARPMFAGAQDGIIYDTFSEMAARNKVAYDYFTTRPGELIEKELARWEKRKAQK